METDHSSLPIPTNRSEADSFQFSHVPTEVLDERIQEGTVEYYLELGMTKQEASEAVIEWQGSHPKEGSEQFFIDLNFAKDEAESLARSWSFQIPDITPDNVGEYVNYLRAGREAEEERRSQMTDANGWAQKLEQKK